MRSNSRSSSADMYQSVFELRRPACEFRFRVAACDDLQGLMPIGQACRSFATLLVCRIPPRQVFYRIRAFDSG